MANFNFTFQPGMSSEQIIGFEMAGRIWSRYLQDDSVFNVHVAKTDKLPPTVVGGALPTYVSTNIAAVQSAMTQDATSTEDAVAIANLNTEVGDNGSTQYSALLNEVSYQSSDLSITQANAKALGLTSLVTPNAVDGYVLFNSFANSSFAWDYDFSRTSASSSRQIDFLSMALHELGHIMGFTSGVDVIGDIANQENLGQTSLLDLFRYSDRSTDRNARELTPGQAAYFSIDGGQTQIAPMSNGLMDVLGGVEGYQASHWAYQAPSTSNLTPEVPKFDLTRALLDLINISAPVTSQDAELAQSLQIADFLSKNEVDIGAQTETAILESARQATYKSLGIMDPVLVPGFRSNISSLDLQALDVIGYNRREATLSLDYAALLQETRTALAQKVNADASELNERLATSSLIQDRQIGLSAGIVNNQNVFERRRSSVSTRSWSYWQEDGLDPTVVNIVSDGAGNSAQITASAGRTQVTTVQAIPYAQLFYRSDTLIGSDASDYIFPVLVDDESVSINTGGGNNFVVLGNFAAEVTAAEGDDTIIGVDSRDSTQNVNAGYTVNAGEGNNYLFLTSELASVEATTGSGNDYIAVGSDNNVVEAGDGNNQIYSYGLFGLGINGVNSLVFNADFTNLGVLSVPSTHRISTGNGNDSIYLLTKDATVTTTGGDNTIHIQGAQNSRIAITAGDGNDEITLIGNSGVVNAGDGNNVITITNHLEIPELSADSFSVTTGKNNDAVRLSLSQANVSTGEGNDIIDFAVGQGSITTGAGNDLIILGDREGAYTRFGTQAFITDFSAQDSLLLHGAQQDYQLTSTSLLYQGQRLADFQGGVNFTLESAQVFFTETDSGANLADQVGAGPKSFKKPLSPLAVDNERRPLEERYNALRKDRPLSYAITGGDDAELFSINSVTGAVHFRVAPDTRVPQDADGDNIYDVIVQASLGDGQARRDSDTQRLAIRVSANSIGDSANPSPLPVPPSPTTPPPTTPSPTTPSPTTPSPTTPSPTTPSPTTPSPTTPSPTTPSPTTPPPTTPSPTTPSPTSPPPSSIPSNASEILGDSGNNLLKGTQDNDVIQAKGGNDTILAGAGNDRIAPTDALSRGAGETDYIDLGSGQDTVVLGDADGSYYKANGWADSVYIDGFTAGEDKLVLAGSADQYLVSSNAKGSWVLLGNDFSTAVAYLNGVTELDLTGSSVTYIEAANKGKSATTTADVSPSNQSSLANDIVKTAPTKSNVTPTATDNAIAPKNIIQGTIGNDALGGTLADDQLLGIGGLDYLEGRSGSDQFVLGNASGSFYVQSGWNDSAYIEDFEVGVDQLVLHGSAAYYTTENKGQDSLLYANGDYIAYLKGVTNIDLSAAKYVS